MEEQIYRNKVVIGRGEKENRNSKKKRSTNSKSLDKSKPRRSHYDITIILIALTSKITTSCSFRSLNKIFSAFSLHLSLELSSPSFSTTKLWVKKVGYAKLTSPKEKADDWILILDESIGIGQEKVLVILGIRRSNINFARPLKLQDMEPLLVKSSEKWTGHDIGQELKIIKEKLGRVIYAVTDGGSSLKLGLKNAGINWVYDITHAIAIFLDRIYRNDAVFKDFTHNAGQMRFKLCCSKSAHLIPPNQRSKSRFLNIDILSKWAIKALGAYHSNKLSNEEKKQLEWIKEIECFVKEMDLLISKIQEISIVLKNEGLSKKSKRKCIELLKNFKEGRLLKFKKQMIKYLNENTVQIIKYKEKLLCCSDVIESTFGKYKNELSKNPMCGITDLVLIIPAFTAKLTPEWIKEAIDSCTVKDIQNWNKENLCASLLTKRKAVYNNKVA